VNFYQRGGRYYCDFYINRKRVRKAMPVASNDEEAKQEAERIYEQEVIKQIAWQPLTVKPICSPGNFGGACELMVCADLLLRGFDVYRSVTRHGKFDLVASKEGRLCRIEVKAARSVGETTRAAKVRADQCGTHDILAHVFILEGRVKYTPDIDAWVEAAR
jgi:Holliday junction resolvase-like predicted endonuclease